MYVTDLNPFHALSHFINMPSLSQMYLPEVCDNCITGLQLDSSAGKNGQDNCLEKECVWTAMCQVKVLRLWEIL